MADQNFMDLASKTASGIAGTDYMMLVNNSEAYKALVNDVAEAILGKLTSKSFSGLETTAKNVIGALNELNSKTDVGISSLQSLIEKITTLKSARTYPIYLSAVAMDEILGTSKNVTGRGLLTIHTDQICDLFVVAGVVPPVTYTLRIESGIVNSSSIYTYTVAKMD